MRDDDLEFQERETRSSWMVAVLLGSTLGAVATLHFLAILFG